MINNKKLTEAEMLARFRVGESILSSLVVESCEILAGGSDRADARVELAFPKGKERFRFVVESKTRGTPQIIDLMTYQAKSYLREGEWPLIQVPYLPPERISLLEKEAVSGVDLCGNGVIIVPNRLCIVRTGQANRYRDSRPLNNPYRGRSAMVGRMLLSQPDWITLSSLRDAILANGENLSLPQVSKAIQAMAEDLVLSKGEWGIKLLEPLRLLDKLGDNWKRPKNQYSQAIRLSDGAKYWEKFLMESKLRWAVMGESSAGRYAMISQSGPRRIAVSSLDLAMRLLDGNPTPIANLADIELIESEEAGYYFKNEVDEAGIRWASKLQTWLELQGGDARQQDVASDVRQQLLREMRS